MYSATILRKRRNSNSPKRQQLTVGSYEGLVALVAYELNFGDVIASLIVNTKEKKEAYVYCGEHTPAEYYQFNRDVDNQVSRNNREFWAEMEEKWMDDFE